MRLILITLIVAIVAGVASGGRLSALSTATIRLPGLALVGVGLQFVTGGWIAVAALFASFVLLLVFVSMNVRVPGFTLILVGLALNFAVIGVNQGMPVSRSALQRSGQADTLETLAAGVDKKHHLATSGDALVFLADVIAIGRPIRQVISLGDILIQGGAAWFVIAAMRGGRRNQPTLRDGAEVTG